MHALVRDSVMLAVRAINVLKLTEDLDLIRTCQRPLLKGSRIFSEADGSTSTINGIVVLLVRLAKRHARKFSFRLCEHPVVF